MKFDLGLLEFVECDKDFDKLAICGSDKDLTWAEFKSEVEKLKADFCANQSQNAKLEIDTPENMISYQYKEDRSVLLIKEHNI